ncbi:VOC family protein [Lacipirellula limnantheis]|uniref:Glyoxalase-like domain protein n=1 Tax=Lacipirellula limnantheis TaxID=2528024 RepID=A0A517TV72_9BACT|nr:VOC family protein [Lacipirellula limnantheis]QDT72272.1 Glyoxalase-like domain protein [Lacipirellula limnantheis]
MKSVAWSASPVLGVANVQEAAEYYRDVLGFGLDPADVFQPSPAEPGGVYAIVKRPGAWIHFQIRREQAPPRVRAKIELDAYVYVDDVDGLYADLQRRGAVVLQSPMVLPYGLREIVVEDLNGYRVAFGEFVD